MATGRVVHVVGPVVDGEWHLQLPNGVLVTFTGAAVDADALATVLSTAATQREHPRVLEAAAQLCLQDLLIDGGKVPGHIHLQRVGIALRPRLIAIDCDVHPFATATGVGVVDEGAIEGRLDQVHQRVVDDPIAKRCRGDDARLALVDPKQPVGAGPVGVLSFPIIRTARYSRPFSRETSI